MALKDIFDADVSAVETEVPAQLRFGGSDGSVVIASRTPVADSQEMQDAGFMQRFDSEIDVRVAALADANVTAEVHVEVEIYDDGKSDWLPCKIEKVTASQDGVMLHLSLSQST